MPIKMTMYADPKFKVYLTRDQVRVLTNLSLLHYDSTCQSYGAVGGLLYGWENRFEFNLHDGELTPESVMELNCNRHNLDILCKILELGFGMLRVGDNSSESDYIAATSMRAAFSGTLRAANHTDQVWAPMKFEDGRVIP